MVQFHLLLPSPPGIPRGFVILSFLDGLFPTSRHTERDNSPPTGFAIQHKYVVFVQKWRKQYQFLYNSKTRRFVNLLKQYKYNMRNHVFLKKLKLNHSQLQILFKIQHIHHIQVNKSSEASLSRCFVHLFIKSTDLRIFLQTAMRQFYCIGFIQPFKLRFRVEPNANKD